MSINDDDVYFVLMSCQRDAGRDHSVEIIIKMYLFSVQMRAASFNHSIIHPVHHYILLLLVFMLLVKI